MPWNQVPSNCPSLWSCIPVFLPESLSWYLVRSLLAVSLETFLTTISMLPSEAPLLNPSHCDLVLVTCGHDHYSTLIAFLGGASGKEPACQGRRHRRYRFHPRVRKIPWRRVWQPTPAFLPGESHGQKSLAGHNPWGHTELDVTEEMQHTRTINWAKTTCVPYFSFDIFGLRKAL